MSRKFNNHDFKKQGLQKLKHNIKCAQTVLYTIQDSELLHDDAFVYYLEQFIIDMHTRVIILGES